MDYRDITLDTHDMLLSVQLEYPEDLLDTRVRNGEVEMGDNLVTLFKGTLGLRLVAEGGHVGGWDYESVLHKNAHPVVEYLRCSRHGQVRCGRYCLVYLQLARCGRVASVDVKVPEDASRIWSRLPWIKRQLGERVFYHPKALILTLGVHHGHGAQEVQRQEEPHAGWPVEEWGLRGLWQYLWGLCS